jgi:hypothetical protein
LINFLKKSDCEEREREGQREREREREREKERENGGKRENFKVTYSTEVKKK